MKHLTVISRAGSIPRKAWDIDDIFAFVFNVLEFVNGILAMITNLNEFFCKGGCPEE